MIICGTSRMIYQITMKGVLDTFVTLMFVLENEAIKQKKRQGVALSQALLSTVLSCLNNVRPTGLATRPGNMVRVIDLALILSDGSYYDKM